MKSAGKFAKHLLIASLVILTSFSVAEAQRGGRGGSGGGGRNFGGGGRGFGGGGSFGGGPRISSAPRGGFGGGNRIAVGPRYTPNRTFGGIRGGINIGPGYNYRGNYGRPYYGGIYRRPFFGGYGAYYRGYYPRIGFQLNVLPFGYYPFSYGGYPYYYNEGLFYQQYNDGYQIVAPPIGAEVPRLPRGTQDITIDGQQYFEKDGVYYQKIIDENGKKAYRVAGKDGVLNTAGNDGQDDQQQYDNTDQQPYNNQAPQQYNNPLPKVGDVVNSIPSESKPVIINGEKLFISPDGVYYQEDNSGNTRIFKVVGLSTVDDTSDTISNP
ncbi:MAG: DUF6515 family protein [Janthinobacterium lividum]